MDTTQQQNLSIADVLTSGELEVAVLWIAEEAELEESQAANLFLVVFQLMRGELRPSNFVSAIMNEVGVTEDIARNLAKTINAEVLIDVKDELSRLHGITTPKPQLDGQAQKVAEVVAEKQVSQPVVPSESKAPEKAGVEASGVATVPTKPAIPAPPAPPYVASSVPHKPKPAATPFEEKLKKTFQKSELPGTTDTAKPIDSTKGDAASGDPYREPV